MKQNVILKNNRDLVPSSNMDIIRDDAGNKIIVFLVPVTFQDYYPDSVVNLKFITPSNSTFILELSVENELLNGIFYQFPYKLTTDFTNRAGIVSVQLEFINGNSVFTTNEFSVTVQPKTSVSDIISY